ncbi:MAG TPA: dihydroorotase [Candidatus Cybelea sp.]|jgi:dihydroorotase|nr:dihydroorotase [Candidatus Cybelea sp.]
MERLLIKGGRIVDPANRFDAVRDLRLHAGVVAEIGEHLDAQSGEVEIDAAGAIVAPGFIDMHVHLREPGYPQKETIATGTEAAVRGGFTGVACMPNTNPALDSPPVLDSLREQIVRDARCRVYPVAAMTVGRLGAQPCDYDALTRAGAVAFSDDGDTIGDAAVALEAARRASVVAGVFISHCEDPSFGGAFGRPAAAEDVAVARDLVIAQTTKKNWHLAHLSTRCALELLRFARGRGAPVTCEVTPHHLFFSSESARELGGAARVNPPLREVDDCAALREAVRDGTIDAFASDHAPHTQAEKSGDGAAAAPGFTGLEVAVGAYALALPDLALSRFVELLSTNPARILGVRGGTLARGAPADVTIFAHRKWRVDPSAFASKGKTTPFAGRELPVRILATIVGGELRYRATEIAA